MKPTALQPGDRIQLVSPASPVAQEKLQVAIGILEGAGYRVTLAEHALAQDGFLAGTDEQRVADLHQAFEDPEVRGVLCTRGGYGSARLLPHLNLERIAASGKMFGGFSDITTLHLALNQIGLATLHCPMALTLHYPREDWVIDSFLRSLKGDLKVPPQSGRGTVLVPGAAEGVVTGGCLCLLTDSIATRFPLDARGKILVIEDVDEAPHRVDAMLTHLLNAGILQSAAGLVFGEMTRTDEKVDEAIGGKGWRGIVADRVSNLGIPTILDYPFGHSKNMLSLGLGVPARLDAEAGTVSYLEPLCA